VIRVGGPLLAFFAIFLVSFWAFLRWSDWTPSIVHTCRGFQGFLQSPDRPPIPASGPPPDVKLDQWEPCRCPSTAFVSRAETERDDMDLPADMWMVADPGKLNDTVTVVVYMGKKRRDSWLAHNLIPLLTCPLVKEVLIDWWPDVPFGPLPQDSSLWETPTPPQEPVPFPKTVRLIAGKRDLGERFLIGNETSTDYVLNLDDDRSFECETIFKMAVVAHLYGGDSKLVGTEDLSRSFAVCTETGEFHYQADPGNIILTAAALVPRRLLLEYEHTMPRGLMEMFNRELNCEDMAMNWVAAHSSPDGQAALYLDNARSLENWSSLWGLSWRNGGALVAAFRRSACLNLLVEALTPLPRDWTIPAAISYRIDANSILYDPKRYAQKAAAGAGAGGGGGGVAGLRTSSARGECSDRRDAEGCRRE